MSRATRIGSALAGLVVATGLLAGAPAAHADVVGVIVQDNDFTPAEQEAFTGDSVWFTLSENAQGTHTVTSEQPGLFEHTFDPAAPRSTQFYKVVFNTAGDYRYFCNIHGADLMSGVIRVTEAGATTTSSSSTTTSSTTTTTAPPTTTSSTTPTTAPPTTGTTRPAVTTSTTRPDGTTTAPTTATSAATAPKPSVQGASQPTTTTTKKKSTTTTAKKKKATPATVKTERSTTTTTLLPSLAAALPSGSGEAPMPSSAHLPDATEAGEEAASWVGDEKGGGSGPGKKKALMALGGLGALSLGGLGWRWYHRSSRYLPA